MRDFWYDWGPLVLLLLLIVACFGGIIALDRAICASKVAIMDVPSRWSVMSGCMVSPADGEWVPLENYRWFEDDSR